MTRRTAPLAALAAVVTAALACASPPSQPIASPAGSYTLSTVNGAKLPATVTAAGATVVIYGGSIGLSVDGAVVSHHTQGPAPAGSTSGTDVSSTGNWAANGSAVQLTMHGTDLAGVLQATYAPTVLTVTVAQGRVEKFTK